MGLLSKVRLSTVTASAVALAGALVLGIPTTASASEVSPGTLRLCSGKNFDTIYWINGTSAAYIVLHNAPCTSLKGNSVVTVDARVFDHDSRYIASAVVNMGQGAGLQTGGTLGSPYLWSF